jgi:hypothetical protein
MHMHIIQEHASVVMVKTGKDGRESYPWFSWYCRLKRYYLTELYYKVPVAIIPGC